MKNTQDLLNALRERAGSDRKAAVLVGISQQSFSRWRQGDNYPDDEQAHAIAAQLSLDAAHVLAVIHADKAKTEETRAIWQRIAETFGKAAGLAVVAVAASLSGPAPAHAGFNNSPFSVQLRPEIHIASKRRRKPQGATLGRFAAATARALGMRPLAAP